MSPRAWCPVQYEIPRHIIQRRNEPRSIIVDGQNQENYCEDVLAKLLADHTSFQQTHVTIPFLLTVHAFKVQLIASISIQNPLPSSLDLSKPTFPYSVSIAVPKTPTHACTLCYKTCYSHTRSQSDSSLPSHPFPFHFHIVPIRVPLAGCFVSSSDFAAAAWIMFPFRPPLKAALSFPSSALPTSPPSSARPASASKILS
jgi:hypothetical protein